MRNYLFIILMALIMSGCFATMPDPVKDEYLVDQTTAEKNNMDAIADVIIAKRKEKDKIDDKLKVTGQKIIIAKKKIPVLEDEKKLLDEKQKLYSLQNDEAEVQKINKSIEDNLKQQEQQKAYVKYLQALEDDQEALIEFKHAELAVKVAELNVEKAKIARTYQEKNFATTTEQEGEGESSGESDKKETQNLIKVSTYEDYYTKQKKLQVKKEEKKKNTSRKLAEAKKTLEQSGFNMNEL